MGERKVLNKYFPPDFDPSKVPRTRRPPESQIVIRMMLPMTLRCKTCGEYMYMGKKFNSRKETVLGEDYLGLPIFRFYMKCVVCSSEFTIKTDPKNSDYVAERNVLRSTEPWRKQRLEDEAKEKELAEEGEDSMKNLEKSVLASRAEEDNIDELRELRAISDLHAKVDADSLIAEHRKRHEELTQELEKQDMAIAQQMFSEAATKRIADPEDSDEDEGHKKKPSLFAQRLKEQQQKSCEPPAKRRNLGVVAVKMQPKTGVPVVVQVPPSTGGPSTSVNHTQPKHSEGGSGSDGDGGVLAGIAGYGSSSGASSGSEQSGEEK